MILAASSRTSRSRSSGATTKFTQTPVRGGVGVDRLPGEQHLHRALAPYCPAQRHHGRSTEQSILTPGVPKTAFDAAKTTRSHDAASWQPAAIAGPCTAAITGCGIRYSPRSPSSRYSRRRSRSSSRFSRSSPSDRVRRRTPGLRRARSRPARARLQTSRQGGRHLTHGLRRRADCAAPADRRQETEVPPIPRRKSSLQCLLPVSATCVLSTNRIRPGQRDEKDIHSHRVDTVSQYFATTRSAHEHRCRVPLISKGILRARQGSNSEPLVFRPRRHDASAFNASSISWWPAAGSDRGDQRRLRRPNRPTR